MLQNRLQTKFILFFEFVLWGTVVVALVAVTHSVVYAVLLPYCSSASLRAFCTCACSYMASAAPHVVIDL